MKKIIGFIVVMLFFAGSASAAEDNWPDVGEGPIISPGTHTGEKSADDNDRFSIRVKKGQYLDVAFTPKQGAKWETLRIHDDVAYELRGLQNAEMSSIGIENVIDGKSAKFEFWAKEDGVVTFEVEGDRDQYWDWTFSFERSNPDVRLIEVEEMENQITDLRSQIENKKE